MMNPVFNLKNILTSSFKKSWSLFFILFFIIGCSNNKSSESSSSNDMIPDDSNEQYINQDVDSTLLDMVKGPSIQVDPMFPYYRNRSPNSVAEEIELAGYKSVHYFVTDYDNIERNMIDAFHDHGIKVWLLGFGNGISSGATSSMPSGWEEWKVELIEETPQGVVYLSPFNEDYVQWRKTSLADIMKKYPFDGIELAEVFLPAWDGLERGSYGDIGLNAKNAFKDEYGLEMPNFKDPNADNYYEKVPSVYKKWIEFRVNGVNNYLDEVFNGEGGVREVRPDALVATWGMGIDAGTNSIFKMEEFQGMDDPSMIQSVKPDAHIIQTHWPDWIKSENELPSDYMINYKPFYDQIKEVAPNLPIGIQADIGSNQDMIKSKEWFEKFEENSFNQGYDITTAYEYFIGGYMYSERPKVKRVNRRSDSIILSFNKRVDKNIASDAQNYEVFQGDEIVGLIIKDLIVDGNMVKLYSEEFPRGSFKIRINNIKDTPELWLYEGFEPNEISTNTFIEIEDS